MRANLLKIKTLLAICKRLLSSSLQEGISVSPDKQADSFADFSDSPRPAAYVNPVVRTGGIG